MAATAPQFDRMVPAAPDAIGALRRELRRWARRQGASPATQANVALAFSEACTSLIGPRIAADGDGDARPGPLMVQAWIDGDELGVRVSHPSRGVPTPLTDIGYGFGLAIIAKVTERFEVRRRDARPGTALVMTFRLASGPGRSSPPRPSRSSPRR